MAHYLLGIKPADAMKCILALCLLVSLTITQAQNLVPNPSFEILDSCPSNLSQIEAAPPWRTFRGSVDLYNTCDPFGIVSVPLNYLGYQMPFEGNGYAGLLSFLADDSLHREFMGAELLSPLVPGVPVYISFRLAIGGWGLAAFSSNLSTSGLGVFFSTAPYLQINGSDPLPGWTAIHCLSAPTDSTEWGLVSGEFIPDSAYTQIVIGVPLNSSELEIVLIDSAFMTPGGAYVFIDDVCVSETAGECPMALGHDSRLKGQRMVPFPNPCTDRLVLDLGASPDIPDHYELYDMRGALVGNGTITVRGITAMINTSAWPAGVFSLITHSRNGSTTSKWTIVHLNP